jgi:hypothetical protein
MNFYGGYMDSLFLKRGLLLMCALSSLTATFAMEMPENEKGKQKVAQKISEVAEDEQCGVCYEDAKTLGESKLQATNCACDKFICSNCVNKIAADADKNAALTPAQRDTFANANHFDPINLSKAKCPFCRKPLAVRPIKLKKDYSQQKPITIIDRDGNSIVLSGQDSAALLHCEVIENMVSEIGDHTIPLDGLPEFITLRVLKKLVECCDNIKIASKYLSNPEENIALFKLASYFCAPANILHFFANMIWLRIQDESDDTQEMKTEKRQLRLMAEPHLANPGHLAAYAKYHRIELQNKIVTDKHWYWHIDISYAKLAPLLTCDDGWYQNDDGQWYSVEFKFGSLKDFKELLALINCDYTHSLDVSGHALTKCDVKEVISASYAVINLILDNNLIQVVDLHGIEDLADINLRALTIKNNPVVAIDDSFYTMIRKKRKEQSYFSFVLKSSVLTDQQKKEMRNKFYLITHTTFPERFINPYALIGTTICGAYGSLIAGVVGTAAVGGKFINRCKPDSFKAESLKVLTVVSMLASMPASVLLYLKTLSVILGDPLYHDGSLWDLEDPEHLLDRIYVGKNFKISIE